MSIYVAKNLTESVYIEVMGDEVKMDLKQLADGCIGVVLVFDSKEAVEAYAGEGNYTTGEKA